MRAAHSTGGKLILPMTSPRHLHHTPQPMIIYDVSQTPYDWKGLTCELLLLIEEALLCKKGGISNNKNPSNNGLSSNCVTTHKKNSVIFICICSFSDTGIARKRCRRSDVSNWGTDDADWRTAESIRTG